MEAEYCWKIRECPFEHTLLPFSSYQYLPLLTWGFLSEWATEAGDIRGKRCHSRTGRCGRDKVHSSLSTQTHYRCSYKHPDKSHGAESPLRVHWRKTANGAEPGICTANVTDRNLRAYKRNSTVWCYPPTGLCLAPRGGTMQRKTGLDDCNELLTCNIASSDQGEKKYPSVDLNPLCSWFGCNCMPDVFFSFNACKFSRIR